MLKTLLYPATVFAHRAVTAWLMSLWLLASQQAVMGHAMEHPFHDRDPLCDHFIVCEHHQPSPTSAPVNFISHKTVHHTITWLPFTPLTPFFRPFQARAPPIQ